jgi:hypothetical protein
MAYSANGVGDEPRRNVGTLGRFIVGVNELSADCQVPRKIVHLPGRWRDSSRKYAGSSVWVDRSVHVERSRPAYLRSRVRGSHPGVGRFLRRHVHVLCVAGARGLDCMGEEAPAQVRGGAGRVELPRRLESYRHGKRLLSAVLR